MDKKAIREEIDKSIVKIEEVKEKRKKSLKAKISVPVVAVVGAAVLTLGIVGSYMSYRSTIKCLEDSMLTAVDLAQQAISNKLNVYDGLINEVSETIILYNSDLSLEEKQAVISKKATEYGFLNAYILSPDGKNVVTGEDYSATDYFQASIKGNNFITSPSLDKATGKIVMTISSPLRSNATGSSGISGVLCFTIPQSVVSSVIADLNVSQEGYAYIMDKDGYFVSYINDKFITEKTNLYELVKSQPALQPLADLHQSAVSGKTDFGQYTYEGVKKFLSIAPIDGTDGWVVCINAPVSDFTGGVKTTILVSSALMLLFLAIGLFGSIYISNRVVNPITVFVKRLSMLADGDVTSPMPEFDAVSTEFYTLKKSLESTLNNTELVISDIDYLLTDISNGHLNVSSKNPERYVGDYQNILSSIEKLKKGLTESFQNILAISEQVSAGSSQVSSGAQTLAQGATEQASSVQELSASITEVSQRIKENANGAEKASSLTEEAKAIMQGSLVEMQLARQAMEEISATSKDIGKVIKAIDDIAFQTNILALNAAVEAARAGSAGKGFAVVADEVRNLSQKSAEAAKNTTSLIESSILAVEKGTSLVNKTSENFNMVALKAAEVTDLVGDISIKAQEQASAISQIAVGIEQVSSVVQMNSATSEESAAASEELSSQAEVLKNLVGQFRL